MSPPKAAPSGQADAGGLGGWNGTTEVQTERTALASPAAVEAPKRETAPANEHRPARSEGRFQVQLAAVRTKAEAMALAAKARREHAVLAASEPHIEQEILGNMGAFYRARFGPFANAQQTQAVCAKLQGSGLDCMPVTR
jgi:cell division septation protein DedD